MSNIRAGVRFQPDVNKRLQLGVHKLAQLIRPTLGPLPRTVVHQKLNDIELLDKGALIARRMTNLPDRREDIGAMYLRHMMWQLYEDVGDGTATAAVLFTTLYDAGLRYLAAGVDVRKLGGALEYHLKYLLNQLDQQTQPVSALAQLQGIARSVCPDIALADVLAELVHDLGEFGRLELRKGGTQHEWSFVEGNYWSGGVLSKRFLEGKTPARIELEDVGVLVTDFQLDDPRELPPILKQALQLGFKKLILIAKTISERAITFLTAPQLLEQLAVIPVKLDGFTQAQDSANHTDLTALVGGYPVVSLGSASLPRARPDDFGRARLVWADQQHVGIIGGDSDPHALKHHVNSLKTAFYTAQDAELRKTLRTRLGRLLGGTITLWVGGASEREVEANQEHAEHTDLTLRSALEQGVLAGGGRAYLTCYNFLQRQYETASTLEERASCHMLLTALEAPLRTMLDNAGLEPSEIIGTLKTAGDEVGYDIRNQTYSNLTEQGILDVASVQKAALRYAVSSVALALTIEAVVHKKTPEQVTAP
ncbi:MAG: TCP-1/cpn60 chaperonin family protein [Deinococcota bacterium]